MAEDTGGPAPHSNASTASLPFETSSGPETQSAVEFGRDGKATVTTNRIEGLSMVAVDPEAKPGEAKPEVSEADKTPLSAAEVQDAIQKEIAEGDAEGEKPEAPEAGEAEKPEAPQPTGEPTEDLGEYKPQDAEVTAKFDARYFNEEGKLNKEALAAEFWGNATKDSPGKLHEGTYAFLENRLGISKDVVNDIEAALVTQHQQAAVGLTARVHEAAGGKDTYNAAIAWASAGGYTPEHGNRLNQLIQKMETGWEDAVEALVSRFRKANPEAPSTKLPPGPPARRSSVPARVAGAAGDKPPAQPQSKESSEKQPEEGQVVPFKNADEYLAALGEALKSGDPKRTAEVRARQKASPNTRS